MTSMLDEALELARDGYVIFPCQEFGKAPLGHLVPHGKDDATTDEATIRGWWAAAPNANIGLATAPSGLVVVDVDVAGGKPGIASLGQLQLEHGPLPPTLTARTGRGGQHRIFRRSPGCEPRTRLGFAAGVDVIGAGYIIVAPSVLADGGRYEWAELNEIAELPPAWQRAIERTGSGTAAPTRDVGTGLRPDTDPAELHRAVLELAAAWPRTGRHTAQLALAGALAGEGWEIEQIAQFAAAVARAEPGREPGYDGEYGKRLVAARTSIAKREAGESVQGWGTLAQALGPSGDAVVESVGKKLGVVDETAAFRALIAEQEAERAPVQTTAPAAQPVATVPLVPEYSDYRNAQRLAAAHGQWLRYAADWQMWLWWDKRRWQRDKPGRCGVTAAKDVVRVRYDEAVRAKLAVDSKEAEERAEAMLKWANKSATEHSIRSMVKLAETEPGIAASIDSFDRQPMLLNVENGTIDLRMGVLREHRQGDMLTQLAPVAYDPAARCPTWDAFLERVLPDAEIRGWLQRFAGYCLSGDVGAQILPFFIGAGANGKSTLLGTIQACLGDYATQGSPGLLLAADRGGDDLGRRQRAGLRGYRLVLCQELEAGRYLNEAQVKQITGGDQITAAKLYEDESKFTPTHKIVVAANHRPQVRGQDHAIWRRIVLVPFDVVIPTDERDPALPAKLMAEAPGILAWLVRGCLEWQRIGLRAPRAITVATDDYQTEEDRLAEFLDAHTTAAPAGVVASSELYMRYREWGAARGERVWSAKAFSEALKERGYRLDRASVPGRGQVRAVLGIELKNRYQQPQLDAASEAP